MQEEVLRLLDPRPGETVADLTVGRGGHAALIAARIGPTGTLVGVDLDAENLAFAADRVRALAGPAFVALHGRFDEAPARLAEAGRRADCVLADLGYASTQIDDPQRGLSFAGDGPLDMRYDRSRGRTAAELLAALSTGELVRLIRHVGEDPYAVRIARAIDQRRRRAPLERTGELAAAVVDAYGSRARASRLHPATRTFMALRIAVNDELNALQGLLQAIAAAAERLEQRGDGPAWLAPGARIAVIAFHALEDRLVKVAFADLVSRDLAEPIDGGALLPTGPEIRANPRARSARLRGVRIVAGATKLASPGRPSSR